MTLQETASSEWYHPIPAPQQICVYIQNSVPDLTLPDLISGEYALYRSDEQLIPSRDNVWPWAHHLRANAAVITSPNQAPTQVAAQTGMTLQITFDAQCDPPLPTTLPMPLLIHQEQGQEPLIRCDPTLLYPTTTQEITQLITAALPQHPDPQGLATQVMTHHAAQSEEPPVGLTREEMKRMADWHTKMAAYNIPGERDGHSVFRITYQDGCTYTGSTVSGIDLRVDQIHGKSTDGRYQPHHVAAAHAQAMPHTVQCLNSSLEEHEARTLRRLLTETNHSMLIYDYKTCQIAGYNAQLRNSPISQ